MPEKKNNGEKEISVLKTNWCKISSCPYGHEGRRADCGIRRYLRRIPRIGSREAQAKRFLEMAEEGDNETLRRICKRGIWR